MKKGFLAFLFMLLTVLPAMAAPYNTSGPWGIDAAGFKNLSTALASPATAGKTVVVSRPMTINNKTTDRDIKVIKGGTITVSSGQTFATTGAIDAGPYLVFNGAGDVIFKRGSNIPLEWFGAVGDGVPGDYYVSLNSIPTGTDSSAAFRKAFRCAMLSAKRTAGAAGYGDPPAVTVMGLPGASYYVQGHNLMGAQDLAIDGAAINFDGRGCRILHRVLTATDALIGNACKLMYPSFKNFQVMVFNSADLTRVGYFVDVNGVGQVPIHFVQSRWEKIRVGIATLSRGYDTVFHIDGTTMGDNGVVEHCNFGAFNTLFYVTNPEAVNWKIRDSYIMPTTANGKIFNFNCAYSGMFTAAGNEILITNDGEQILNVAYTAAQNSKYRIIQNRLEVGDGTNITTTLYKVGAGVLEVEGQTILGGGAFTSSARAAEIAQLATMRCVDSVFPGGFTFGPSPADVGAYYGAWGNWLVTENCKFVSGGTAYGYPFIHILNAGYSEVSLYSALISDFNIYKISVNNPNMGEGGLLLPINYQIGMSYPKTFDMKRLLAGTPYASGFKAMLPPYCVITSMKLFNKAFNVSTVNKISTEFRNGGALDAAASFDTTLDGAAHLSTGLELMPAGYHVVTGTTTPVTLDFDFKLNATSVGAGSGAPISYVEITYRGVSSATDFGASEQVVARVPVF